MKALIILTFFFVSIISCLFVFVTSCTSNSSSGNSKSNNSNYSIPDNSKNIITEKDPYEIMHVAFEGSPEIDKIKPMLEAVLDNYSLPKTDVYRLKVGNMLVALRKASAVGVTEMKILKHIYQNGNNKLTLPQQAGLSATILEKSE